MTKPIARKITRRSDGAHIGWSLYVGDYERAVEAVGDSIDSNVWTWSGDTKRVARAALKAIGIVAPKKAKGAK